MSGNQYGDSSSHELLSYSGPFSMRRSVVALQQKSMDVLLANLPVKWHDLFYRKRVVISAHTVSQLR